MENLSDLREERLVRELWHKEAKLGQRIIVGDNEEWRALLSTTPGLSGSRCLHSVLKVLAGAELDAVLAVVEVPK